MRSFAVFCLFGLATAFPQSVNQQYLPPGTTQTPAEPAPVPPKEIISKYFFIHGAQEDKDKEVDVGPIRKQYKIVFINSPTEDLQSTAEALAKARDQEKTAIYVLTKNVDPAELNNALQSIPATENKPNVYFIKYNTPEEARHAQQQIQAQYDALGGTSVVSDEGLSPITSVVGSLQQQDADEPAKKNQNLQVLPHVNVEVKSLAPSGQTGQLVLASTSSTYLPVKF